MNNETPILVKKVEHLNRQYAKGCESVKSEFQKVVDAYSKTFLPSLSTDDLLPLFTNTEELIFDKMTGGNAHLTTANDARLKINKKHALDMYHKPTGYDELLKAISDLLAKAQSGIMSTPFHFYFSPHNVREWFVIDEMGKLQFTKEVQGKIDTVGNCYATTDKGKAVHKFIAEVVALYYDNGLDKFFNPRIDQRITGKDLASLIAQSLEIFDKDQIVHTTHGFANGNISYPPETPEFKMKSEQIAL